MDRDTYLILGYGRSGKESEKYLLSKGHRAIIYDDSLNKQPDIDWTTVKRVIQSPGISTLHPISLNAQKAGIPICTDINLLQEQNPNAQYIGVTGTNGKSTTTALIGHILKQNGFTVEVGGNIGIPALSLKNLNEKEWYVLELSSYQLELSNNINLDVAVWLNITPDHLERHLTMEKYVATKAKIFNAAKSACIAIDDNYSKEIVKKLSMPNLTIASEFKNYPANLWIDAGGTLHINEALFDLNELATLKGTHNWQNVAVAFAATLQIVQNNEKIWQSIQTFPGLAHRQQLVTKTLSAEFINDSKATNADATEKALKTFLGRKIFWILGGKDKTDGITSLEPYFPHIKKAYLIGDACQRFANDLKGKVNFEKSITLDNAIKHAFEDTKSETDAVILLSPACASFDQFRDFEHRGEEFIRLVKEITHESDHIF